MPDDAIIDPTMKFGIGQPVLRNEDPRLLTGQGEYTDDMSAAGQAHAAFLRSTVAHGTLNNVDTSAAASAPGVIAVYTGKDFADAGLGNIPCPIALKSRDGSSVVVPPRPALAIDSVKHVGDPIAVVIAETEGQARDAAELIEVDIDLLPAVADMEAAVEDGAASVWNDAKNNICLDFFLGDEDAVNEAFANAAHVSRLKLDNTRVVVNAMEPRAALAEYDASNERFTLHVGSQGVTGYRNTLANAIFGISPENVRVITKDVGGSFGMKGASFNESIACMFAARALGRPVKWCADRSESFLTDHQGRASIMDLELALDGDGNFLALRVNGLGDMGAYLTTMGPWPATNVTVRNIISVYKTPQIAFNTKCVFTNTVPTGPYRGAGRPESKFFLERLIDQAAAEMGIDRIEIRRKNLIPSDALPWQTPVDLVYDSGDFEAILDETLAKADWNGFASRRAESEAAGKLRGIGLAPYLETTAPPGTELADIRFGDDGFVTLVTGTKDFGMGHATPFAQVLSSQLGVPFEKIRMIQWDSDEMSEGAGGSGGSRSMIAAGGAIVEASEIIVDLGKQVAGHVLEAATEDIEFDAGTFRVAGTDRAIGIMELEADIRSRTDLPADMPKTLSTKVNHSTSPISFPNGCHVAEVEVDPDTGTTEIVKYTVVDDFGTVINPLIVEGQVHGGIVQGIGQVLMENTVYDADGQLLTGSFMDYAMPRADEIADIDFSTHPVPCKTNPLGAKGCGEAGNGGSYPVIITAILDALASKGVKDVQLPASPHRIWQAIQAAS